MKATLLSVWRENNTRASYPLLAGLLFVLVVSIFGFRQGNGFTWRLR